MYNKYDVIAFYLEKMNGTDIGGGAEIDASIDSVNFIEDALNNAFRHKRGDDDFNLIMKFLQDLKESYTQKLEDEMNRQDELMRQMDIDSESLPF